MSHPESLLVGICNELKRIFEFDCPIIFVHGALSPNGREAQGTYSPLTKTIKVQIKSDILEIIRTICHEVVHFKQHTLGHLKGTADMIWYSGKWYPKSMPYKDQPWEIDARKYETRMFDTFCHKASYKLVEAIRDYQATSTPTNP